MNTATIPRIAMKATFILKGLSHDFYHGCTLHGHTYPAFLELDNAGKWARLSDMAHKPEYDVSIKVGNGSFRDRVELNALLRNPNIVTCTLEPRKGYKLVTFEFAK